MRYNLAEGSGSPATLLKRVLGRHEQDVALQSSSWFGWHLKCLSSSGTPERPSQAEKSELQSSRWVCHSNSFLISYALPPLDVLSGPAAIHVGLCRFVIATLMAWTIWFFWRAWKFPVFFCTSVFFYGRTHECVESCEDGWRSLPRPSLLWPVTKQCHIDAGTMQQHQWANYREWIHFIC